MLIKRPSFGVAPESGIERLNHKATATDLWIISQNFVSKYRRINNTSSLIEFLMYGRGRQHKKTLNLTVPVISSTVPWMFPQFVKFSLVHVTTDRYAASYKSNDSHQSSNTY